MQNPEITKNNATPVAVSQRVKSQKAVNQGSPIGAFGAAITACPAATANEATPRRKSIERNRACTGRSVQCTIRAGSSVVEHLTFNHVVVGPIPTRLTF